MSTTLKKIATKAKSMRKKYEKWTDAIKRATKQLKKEGKI
jgi:hypothetical protein